ncbi:hypothetical protein EB796_023568 [Bugula neritina]|uniref:Uncharacterized protein n=1 Tax=Bugula neritina TaxID=10212 RepID=A0A7J7IX71_BUGNE|nr:hypothetical protein EB796_023568 [Bugula neritina]
MLFYVCCVIYFYLYTNTTDETGQTITTDSLPSTPGIQRTASQLSEDDQVKIAQRIGLIQHLPTGLYYNDSSKKTREYEYLWDLLIPLFKESEVPLSHLSDTIKQ